MRLRSNGLDLRQKLTGDSLGFRGSTTPGGGYSRYSPGCTHFGGENGLERGQTRQNTVGRSCGLVTYTSGGSLYGGDEVPVSLGIMQTRALVVLEGAPNTTSHPRFYTRILVHSAAVICPSGHTGKPGRSAVIHEATAFQPLQRFFRHGVAEATKSMPGMVRVSGQ